MSDHHSPPVSPSLLSTVTTCNHSRPFVSHANQTDQGMPEPLRAAPGRSWKKLWAAENFIWTVTLVTQLHFSEDSYTLSTHGAVVACLPRHTWMTSSVMIFFPSQLNPPRHKEHWHCWRMDIHSPSSHEPASDRVLVQTNICTWSIHQAS